MTWPTPQDYNEAIQNPRMAFTDPALAAGIAECGHLGLPRARSGNYATVYKVECGGKPWAVRCFLRCFQDQQERYAAIDRHLRSANLPYTVGFSYLAQGISVHGGWYPVLKMEWVEGARLDLFVQQHLWNSARLAQLVQQWTAMVKATSQASIAHGDLQHGNILVLQDRLQLIDYDGMYVPALSGRGSHEKGHRNYQHPRRDEADFGPSLDNFSAWLIWLSLGALVIHPQLWQVFRGGDECLLLREADLRAPERSLVFRALEATDNPNLRSVAARLRSFLRLAPAKVPPLDPPDLKLPIPAHTASFQASGRVAADAERHTLPDWILTHFPGGPARDAAVALGSSPKVVPRINESLIEERTAIISWACASAFWGLMIYVGLMSVLAGLLISALGWTAVIGFVVFKYRRTPGHDIRKKLVGELRGLQKQLRDLTNQQNKLQARLDTLGGEEQRELSVNLRRIQSSFASQILARSDIRDASIYGIGPELKSRLWGAGIQTAADVDYWKVRRVEGFGEARAASVLAWRRQIDSYIESSAPHTVPASVERAIRSRFARERSDLRGHMDWNKRRLADKSTELTPVERNLASLRAMSPAAYVKAILFFK